MRKTKKFAIGTDDGKEINATIYQDLHSRPHLIIICPAAGAPQFFYKKFAEFASGSFDFDVITFDYRGVGDSLKGSVKEDPSCMSDWGQYDLKAIIDWADRKYEKIFLVGHSVAGQIFPKASNCERISAAYFVASQTAYYGYWPGWQWVKVSFFWHLVLPFSTYLFGYLPGWTLGSKVPMPKGVALEWRKWGMHPTGVLQNNLQMKSRFNSVGIPMHFVSIEDDKLLAPARATQELMHYYGNAKTTFQYIRPQDLGLQKIGHFGFFRSKHQEKLWSMPILFFTQFIEKLVSQ